METAPPEQKVSIKEWDRKMKLKSYLVGVPTIEAEKQRDYDQKQVDELVGEIFREIEKLLISAEVQTDQFEIGGVERIMRCLFPEDVETLKQKFGAK